MSTRAKDSKLGGVHEMLATIYDNELKLMVEAGDYDIGLLKSAQAFLKDNNITSNLEDSPELGSIQSSVITLDESALPTGHDYKVVNG
jgi:hypothetical protein